MLDRWGSTSSRGFVEEMKSAAPVLFWLVVAGLLVGCAAQKWACGGKTGFIPQCGRCVANDQCVNGTFCCPSLKICQKSGVPCPPPYAACSPAILSQTAKDLTQKQWDDSKCGVQAKISLSDWVDCGSASGISSPWGVSIAATVVYLCVQWLA